MLLIYHKLHPTEKLAVPAGLNWTYLSKEERKRVKQMLLESNDNDLLLEMLTWFSINYLEASDDEVLSKTATLQQYTTNPVREAKRYQAEYLKIRKDWKAFIGQEDEELGGAGGLSAEICRLRDFVTSVNPRGEKYDVTDEDVDTVSEVETEPETIVSTFLACHLLFFAMLTIWFRISSSKRSSQAAPRRHAPAHT